MSWVRRLHVMMLVLMAIVWPQVASARTVPNLETRVGNFDLVGQVLVGVQGLGDPGNHRAESFAYGDSAPGYSLAAEGLEGAAAAARTEFTVADRVAGQLADSRLGSMAGKISPEQLQELAHNPNALKFLDTASGHTNTMQVVEGRLLRITTAGDDATRIISVGPMQRNGLFNGIANGRFTPLVE